MKGPFAIVVGAALALLIVGMFFSIAPAIGGSAEEASPILGAKETMSLLNKTNVSSNHKNIGNVLVYNKSTMTYADQLTS